MTKGENTMKKKFSNMST